MVSHAELGSDPAIGLDRESGCDRRFVPSSTAELCGEAFDAREREVEPQS